MARIRTIKPSFFTSLTIAGLSLEARLTFIGLWTHVDDDGRCVDDARLIKAAVWPLDDRTARDVEGDLGALSESSLIARYTVRGRRFLAVSGWSEHQRINRRTPSAIPGPDEADDEPETPLTSGYEPSVSPHGALTEVVHREVEVEGKGREQGTATPRAPRERPTAQLVVAEPTAQTLLAEWINHCQETPPGRVKGQVAKEVGQMLREGIPADRVRAGLAAWSTRGLHPSTLPSVVHEIGNARGTRGRSTTDERVAEGLRLSALYAREDHTA